MPSLLYDDAGKWNGYYRPLLWSLATVEHCHKHGIRLEEQCPHCGESQPIIPRWPDIAFCDFYRGALFDILTLPGTSHPTHLLNIVRHRIWLHVLTLSRICTGRLEMAITELCEGNRAEFCRQIGLSVYAFGEILRNQNRPSFNTLLRIGYALDLLPSQLLIGHRRPVPETLCITRRILGFPRISRTHSLNAL